MTEMDLIRELEWLNANRDKYRGEWIAVFCGKLIARAGTAVELHEKLCSQGMQRCALVSRIPEDNVPFAGW